MGEGPESGLLFEPLIIQVLELLLTLEKIRPKMLTAHSSKKELFMQVTGPVYGHIPTILPTSCILIIVTTPHLHPLEYNRQNNRLNK